MHKQKIREQKKRRKELMETDKRMSDCVNLMKSVLLSPNDTPVSPECSKCRFEVSKKQSEQKRKERLYHINKCHRCEPYVMFTCTKCKMDFYDLTAYKHNDEKHSGERKLIDFPNAMAT
uniref:C2H2-type domain-containing protein n=1 Tax=Ditylenchus dipsaci TaxID=166011 RepID=A0A915E869_9BILA